MRLVWVLVSSVACVLSALVAALWVGILPTLERSGDDTLATRLALRADADKTRTALALVCAQDVRVERLAAVDSAEAASEEATRLAESLARELSGEVSVYRGAEKVERLSPGAPRSLAQLKLAKSRRIASAVSLDAELIDACVHRGRSMSFWIVRTKRLAQLLSDAGLEPTRHTVAHSQGLPASATPWQLETAGGDVLQVAPVSQQPGMEAQLVPLALSCLLAALVGALLGLFLTRQAPVDESVLATLEKAAERVAQGDLSSQIGVRFGGRADQTVRSFDRMTAELRDMRGKLAEAERAAAWQDMAQRIAHEIKNPLSPIKMALETLRKARDKRLPAFDEIFEESTRAMLEEVQRMEHIVREFSDFARLPKARPGAMSLGQLLKETAGLYAPEDVELELVTPESEAPIHADREQLTQVLTNLIANAVHAARLGTEGPRLRLSLTQTGDETVLQVEDNGPGVPEAERERIFEPYVTDKSEGTGLGLAIARRIANDHGGSIGVDESPMGGARFTLSLPGARD